MPVTLMPVRRLLSIALGLAAVGFTLAAMTGTNGKCLLQHTRRFVFSISGGIRLRLCGKTSESCCRMSDRVAVGLVGLRSYLGLNRLIIIVRMLLLSHIECRVRANTLAMQICQNTQISTSPLLLYLSRPLSLLHLLLAFLTCFNNTPPHRPVSRREDDGAKLEHDLVA
eukprot:141587-Amorphochlora_amoeboformis.AAC.1